MERKELFEWAKEIYGAEPDYPWNDWNCVLRHKNNKKWFALVRLIVDYIVANGNIEDNKVLMEEPFRSVGSIIALFKDDMTTAKQIMEVVAQIRLNSEIVAVA